MITRNLFVLLSITSVVVVLLLAQKWPAVHGMLVIVLPLIGLGIFDLVQRKHTILRIYPVIGHLRYLFESVRTEIQQYFVESNTNGVPFSREFRDLVYQRAKGVQDTRPFGTQFDVYREGYEWINHSLEARHSTDTDPRVLFGGGTCRLPYQASVLNISAMSFGALSQNAVMALNKGAKLGGFAHNTGEGGISPYHLEWGGDLIWQIGTGYFGCRNDQGGFDEVLFAENATLEVVRMIEIKLSQGAKPGHGGILPAAKLTEEIARIRRVSMGQDVVSPPMHSAFTTPLGLIEFIGRLRDLSGGKPVGIKLCIGDPVDFLAICKAMLTTGDHPDFVTVDGAEGGTGAAPVEFTNSVGTPLREGLSFVHDALRGTGLRENIRIIAAGKAVSAFHVARLLALGADTINAARAMMFALGCIQSRNCHRDICPTGIATQNPGRFKALDVGLKSVRIANYHASVMKNLMELVGAAGLDSAAALKPEHIHRRVDHATVKTYAELYPGLGGQSLLDASSVSPAWQRHWELADAERW